MKVTNRKIDITMLGESHVGKTALVQRYLYYNVRYYSDDYKFEEKATIGIDVSIKKIEKSPTEVIIAKIWDTAGQEKYRSLTTKSFEKTDGILLVFDLSDRKSFESVHFWVDSINEVSNVSVITFLVGNKVDLVETRIVTKNDAMKFAAEHKMKYYETSAKDNIQVTEVFETLIEEIYNRPNKKKNGIVLKNNSIFGEEVNPQKKCC